MADQQQMSDTSETQRLSEDEGAMSCQRTFAYRV